MLVFAKKIILNIYCHEITMVYFHHAMYLMFMSSEGCVESFFPMTPNRDLLSSISTSFSFPVLKSSDGFVIWSNGINKIVFELNGTPSTSSITPSTLATWFYDRLWSIPTSLVIGQPPIMTSLRPSPLVLSYVEFDRKQEWYLLFKTCFLWTSHQSWCTCIGNLASNFRLNHVGVSIS
ncbi:hypothetical protein HMI54_014443 [Coelomomyces lativittatus]|nr:hypothetical protein HMI55_000436 [Coelomomyces lativittatus]KAJ1508292.1 hypothetical protein HMI56_007358 [Coelomomyces lativittatus]KAJ1514142.1 hypothetical protein HMI54_014443 [Coelomomyces lativittatus]